MANIPPRGRHEPAEAYLDRILPELRKALAAVAPGSGGMAVDGAGNLYLSPAIPAGSVPKLTVAPKIVKIDTENLVSGAVTLAATDIPDMVLARKVVAGDLVTLSLLAGEIEAVEARIDNLAVNDANIANLSASKLTAGDVAVELNLYAANLYGGKMEITGASSKLLALQSTVSDYVIAVDQRDGAGGGISVIIPAGHATSGNAIDVAMRGSGNGVGVRAYDTAKGVLAVADGDNAIQGECTGASNAGLRGIGGQYGVWGSAGGTGYGVYGTNDGSGSGVRGESSASGGFGVHGRAGNGSVAVGGVNTGAGNGVAGSSSSGDGVVGASASGSGVRGSGDIGGEFSSAGNIATRGTTSTGAAFYGTATSSGYANSMANMIAERSGSAAYNFFAGASGGGSDIEVLLRGDGNGFCDGAWTGGGADFAEFFESTDGAAIPVGSTVVLAGGKLRAATAEDDPDEVVGVVRPEGASTVVGNAAWNRWAGKFLTDDYGTPLLDADGNRVPNPNFDPSLAYLPRSARPEWVIVGLVGQVAVTKGQPVNPRWRKMGDIGPAAERWFIR